MAELSHRLEQPFGAVPAPEGAGEDGQHAGRPAERQGTRRARMEARRVSAPFELQDLRRGRCPREDRGAGGDDHAGAPADALAPAPHRFDQQHSIEPRLVRARVVDHRRVDFEHRSLPERRSGQNPFAAEVVVALDDRIGIQRTRESRDGTRARPAQLLAAERRTHRRPPDRTGWKGAAAR